MKQAPVVGTSSYHMPSTTAPIGMSPNIMPSSSKPTTNRMKQQPQEYEEEEFSITV